MKTLFIPSKAKSKLNKSKISEISKKLPKNIAIAYSVQYKNIAEQIKQILSKKHKITRFIQILGCSKPISTNTDAILLIGSGKFHAISLAVETNLPVYILNNDSFGKISKEEIDNLKKQKKASYLKFLNSDKVGILISTKPGQENLKKAIGLKSKLKKNSYLFIANNINTNEFQNFGLNTWINTACPRLDFDSDVINTDDLEKLLHISN